MPTSRLGMELVNGTDPISAGAASFRAKVNDALNKLDATAGRIKCTSTTRPTTNLYAGMEIYETDTGRGYINLTGALGDWKLLSESVVNNIGSGRIRVTKPLRAYGGDTAHSAFPDITQLSNGNLLMVYRQGTDHVATRDGVIKKATSVDQGRTWTAATTVYDDPTAGVDLRDPCVSMSRDGTKIYLTYFKGTAALAGAGVYWRASTDGGVNWSAEVRVDAQPYAASSAKCIELDNGTLVVPFYGKASGDTFDSVWLAKSTNSGASWTQTRILNGQTASNDYQEPWMILKGQAAVIAYRHGTATSIGITTSSDNTANWSGASAKFSGTGRPFIFWANDVTIGCIYRNLNVEPGAYNASIRYSRDNGANWFPPRLMEKVWNAGGWMAYAGGERLSNGSTIVAMANESSTTLCRIFFAYAGDAGAATPFGSIETESEASVTNSDGYIFATNFDQADGVVQYPWFVVAGAVTVTNGELQSASADNVVDLPVVYANTNDMEVEAEINCGGTGTIQSGAGIIFRMVSATTYLMFTIETQGQTYRLYKVVGGTATLLERNGDSPGAAFDYTVGVRTLPFNQYVKYKVICRERYIWVFINDQWIVASSGAGQVFPSAMLSASDYSTFQSGKWAGVKLNAQSTTTHKCRRFTVKG